MMTSNGVRRLLSTAAMALAAVILFAAPGGASATGTNGRVAYDRADQFGNQIVLTANPDGTQERH